MAEHFFGTPAFGLRVSEITMLADRPHLSQVAIQMAGQGWSLESGVDETIGVVAGGLARFLGSSPGRHWGSFAGLQTYEEVLDRVLLYGFGMPTSNRDHLQWVAVSSSMVDYSLSRMFDYGLGVDHLIAIRWHKKETLIWRTTAGDLHAHEVPVIDFDFAIEEFIEWAEGLMHPSGRDE